MAENKKTYLDSLSRYGLNKFVQRSIYSYTFKKFSSYLNNMSIRGNLGYDKVLSKVQLGLFGESGNDLKETKNMPSTECLPDYMSSNELIMYRETIEKVMDEYDYLQSKISSFNNYYKIAEEIGLEVYDEFKPYKNTMNKKLRPTFFDKTGIN